MKIPASWEQDKKYVQICAAYLVFKYNVLPNIFLNMYETQLMNLASVRKTWAKKGAKNLTLQGGTEKGNQLELLGKP